MKIVWSAQARADLRAIRDYIARDSVHYADLAVQRLIERVERAASAPTGGHPVHEYPERPLREVHQGNHRIIYRHTRARVRGRHHRALPATTSKKPGGVSLAVDAAILATGCQRSLAQLDGGPFPGTRSGSF